MVSSSLLITIYSLSQVNKPKDYMMRACIDLSYNPLMAIKIETKRKPRRSRTFRTTIAICGWLTDKCDTFTSSVNGLLWRILLFLESRIPRFQESVWESAHKDRTRKIIVIITEGNEKLNIS